MSSFRPDQPKKKPRSPLISRRAKTFLSAMLAFGVARGAETRTPDNDIEPPKHGDYDPGDEKKFDRLEKDFDRVSQRRPDPETLREWNNHLKKYTRQYLNNQAGRDNYFDGLSPDSRDQYYNQWAESMSQAINRADRVVGVERESIRQLLDQLHVIRDQTDLYNRLDNQRKLDFLKRYANLILKFTTHVYQEKVRDYGVAAGCIPADMIVYLDQAEDLLREALVMQKSQSQALVRDPLEMRKRQAGVPDQEVRAVEDKLKRIQQLRSKYIQQLPRHRR